VATEGLAEGAEGLEAMSEEAPKKKVIKKVAAEPVPEPVAAVAEEAPKKKIVKKKV
jgi:hypothetical protein